MHSETGPSRPLEDHRQTLTFVVLAGGRSSRFGANKLMTDVAGKPLLTLVLAAIPQGFPTVIAGSSFEAQAMDLKGAIVVAESPSHGGPLAGLLAAADHIRTPGVVVVGGDMPNVVPGALQLASRFDPEAPGALVATDPRGKPQPLCAVFPAHVLRRAGVVLGSGRDLPLQALLDLVRPKWVPLPDHMLSDIDRPKDLDRLRATVAEG